MRKVIVAVLIFTLLASGSLSGFVNASVEDNKSGVGFAMRLDEPSFIYEGTEYHAPSPVILNDVLYLPFVELAEAFGAEIVFDGDEAITARFHNSAIVIKVDADEYILNNENIEVTGALVDLEDALYLRADVFDDFMNTVTSYNPTSGEIYAFLANDGNVTDLSKLLGEITARRVGNSYFGWSMEAPIKSVVMSKSFNSASVQIYNKLKNIFIEVEVTKNNGDTYEDFMEFYEDSYRPSFNELNVVGTGSERYLEGLYENYESIGVMRIFIRSRFIFKMNFEIINQYYYEEETPELFDDPANILKSETYAQILDSFEIRRFAENDAGIYDLSNIVNNKVKYTNIINIPESSKRIKNWSMDVSPDWYEVEVEDDSYSYDAALQSNYISSQLEEAGSGAVLDVIVYKPYNEKELDNYFAKYKEEEAKFWNPELYSFIGGKRFSVNGYDALDVEYSLERPKEVEVNYERMIRAGSIAYIISLSMPEKLFVENREAYLEMINTFEFDISNLKAIERNLNKRIIRQARHRVSKDDEVTAIGNVKAEWSAELPGYWVKLQTYSDSYDSFVNKRSGAYVIIYTIENSSDYGYNVEQFLSWIMDSTSDDVVETLSEGVEVEINEKKVEKNSLLRGISDESNEIYRVESYLIRDKKNTYLVISEIPLIHLSENNAKELDDFIQSFRCGSDSENAE